MSLKKSEKEIKHKKFLINKYKKIMKSRQKKNKKSCRVMEIRQHDYVMLCGLQFV